MQTKQEIILRHYRAGDSLRKIARDLCINRKTVTKYVNEYQSRLDDLSNSSPDLPGELIEDIVVSPKYQCINRPKRKLTPEIVTEVEHYLEQNQQKRIQGKHKQQLKKIDIHELLCEKGYDIGYTSICNLVRSIEQKVPESFICQQYEAGDVCEFDWGEVKIDVGKGPEKFQLAVFTSAYGNYRYGVLFKHQDTQSFLQAHALFFDKIQGVYKTMVYDNMKVVIRNFVGPSEKEPTDALLKLSMYYHFSFRFCNVRRGNEKGHVERSVEVVRRKAFAKQDCFANLAEANKYLEHICDHLNDNVQKKHINKSATMLLQEEQAYLYPVKPKFECGDEHSLKVDKYSTISYKTCRYSVPEQYNGQIVRTKIYPDKIICYNEDNDRICSHLRLNGLHEWSINIEHYTKTLKKKPGALAGSIALSQINSRLGSIYKKYYINREREFIDLIEYIRDWKVSINDIDLAIKKLQPVKTSDITLDKIKILCHRNDKKTEQMTYNHGDEISNSCHHQLKELTRLFPDSHNLTTETTEVN